MTSLFDLAILPDYELIKKHGDKLAAIAYRINWETLRPPLKAMFKSNAKSYGQPDVGVIVMLKSLFVHRLENLKLVRSNLKDLSSIMISFVQLKICFWRMLNSSPDFTNSSFK